MENDKARFIIRDTRSRVQLPAHLTRSSHRRGLPAEARSGNASPPYPAGRDAFHAMTPLINISSTDNPQTITIVNDGTTSGGPPYCARRVRTISRSVDGRVAIKQFSTSLSVPPSAIDQRHPGHGLERLLR